MEAIDSMPVRYSSTGSQPKREKNERAMAREAGLTAGEAGGLAVMFIMAVDSGQLLVVSGLGSAVSEVPHYRLPPLSARGGLFSAMKWRETLWFPRSQRRGWGYMGVCQDVSYFPLIKRAQ